MQVEKSLQRINRGYKNAMYTSQKSIENKVGGGSVDGWKDLLMAVGFRFEPAANGIPAAVFFPQSDPGERLTQASASLQALLGLSPTSWSALARLLTSPSESVDEILALVRQAVSQFAVTAITATPTAAASEAGLMLPVSVRLWRVPGCHELLASLGFDLMEVGRDEVTLRTGKAANRRQIQFALSALIALFDTDEAPRSLDDVIDSSSDSMEDYATSGENLLHSATSPPPLSMVLPPPPPPPFPAPRKSDLILDGSAGSAFSSYARNRGEPDGRQAQGNSPTNSNGLSTNFQNVTAAVGLMMPSLLYQSSSGMYGHQKGGRESDCNFTPSPVDSWRGGVGAGRFISHQYTAAQNNSPGSLDSTLASSSPLHSTAYSPSSSKYAAANTRFAGKLGPSPLSRPESSSSAASGSGQDWEAAAATVVRRTNGHHHHHHHHHHQQLNSKLSPSVTSTVDSTGTAAGFRKYLLAANSNTGLYDAVSDDLLGPSFTGHAAQIIPPVRSIFTETGYHSRLLSEAVAATTAAAASQNDRLSIRAEMGSGGGSQAKFSGNSQLAAARRKDNGRLEPGVTTRVPPTGESNSPKGTLTNSKATAVAVAEPNSNSTGSLYNNTVAESARSNSSSSGVMMRNTDNLGGEASAIKEHIMASQMRRLNRELPISEVYHERSIGLGLAPPLSKLILSNSIAVAQVDHHPEPSNSSVASSSDAASSSASSPHLLLPPSATMDNSLNSFDNLSAIEDAHHQHQHHHRHPPKTVAAAGRAVKRPPIPAPKPRPESSWMGAGLIQTAVDSGLMTVLPHPLAPPSLSPSGTRDDGDGRSMTDSQYSGCSPSATAAAAAAAAARDQQSLLPRFNYMTISSNGQEIKKGRGGLISTTTALHLPTEEEEDEVQVFTTDLPAAIINPTNIRPSDVAHYINSEFHSRNNNNSKSSSSNSSSTKHPHLWVKDKNGRFTYNGNFSSDC